MAPIGGVRAGYLSAGKDAIPDTSMFQDPIYQWWGGSGIGVSDGQEATDWEDGLSSINANAVGSPTYRADQSGFEAVEYDGSGEAHDWSSDSQLPTGSSPVSVACLIYVPQSTTGTVVGWGKDSDKDAFWLGTVDDESIIALIPGATNPQGGTFSTGQWITIGFRYDGSDADVILSGSQVGSEPISMDITDENHAIGYRRSSSGNYFDGFVAETVVSATDESDQAFSDYDTNRLG